MKKRAKNPQFNHTKKELFKPLIFDQVFKQPLLFAARVLSRTRNPTFHVPRKAREVCLPARYAEHLRQSRNNSNRDYRITVNTPRAVGGIRIGSSLREFLKLEFAFSLATQLQL